jgi:trimeric autotransporter adhesin
VTITNRVSLKSVMAGVTPIADVPDAPTIGAATNVGTSRAYNNGSATVAYTAAATGGTATTFTATSTPGSFTGTGTSPITVTGLQSATSYTFTVSAANANGTLTSAASSSITATTVPAAPTIGTATLASGQSYSGSASISVPFTAPATGGAAISSYTVTSSSGNTGTGSSSPVSVSETVGNPTSTARTYTVTATNANGTSAASAASNSIAAVSVPQAPTIGAVTAGSGSATVAYTANATGGAAVSTFTATSSPGGLTGTGASPITVSGLTNGTAYTFTVTATNSAGTSTTSSASSSVTPVEIGVIQAWSTGGTIPNLNDNNQFQYFMAGPVRGSAGTSSYRYIAVGGNAPPYGQYNSAQRQQTDNQVTTNMVDNNYGSPPGITMGNGSNPAWANNYNGNGYAMAPGTSSSTVTQFTNYTGFTNIANYPTGKQNLNLTSSSLGVYGYGGQQQAGGALSENYRWTSNSWTSLASMPAARAHGGAVAGGGYALMVGGAVATNQSDNVATVYLYNESANTWSTVTNYPQSKSNMMGAHVATGSTGGTVERYYMQGGFLNGFGEDTNSYSYSVASNAWRAERSTPNGQRYASYAWTSTTTAANNILTVAGGNNGSGTQRTTYYAQVI